MILKTLAKFKSDESGATAIQYGLIVSLIAASLLTALAATGDGLEVLWDRIQDGADEMNK